MSKYHFLRTFRRTVGSTPHQYLLDLRLRRCAVEVRIRNDSVSRVAADAGFGDLSTFYQRFRKVFGVSPQVLRESYPL
jgi:AraC family transcriptional regulator